MALKIIQLTKYAYIQNCGQDSKAAQCSG